MNVLDEFMKSSLDKGTIEVTKDIVGSMRLVDFGVITKQYDDGTCDVTCIKSNRNGDLIRYHGVEILYPCGIRNMKVNQMCLLVNPFSSVYRTEDIENPDFIGDHDQRCIKAIPVSNRVTDIFAGMDIGGNFTASNGAMLFSMRKWSAYFGMSDNSRTGVTLFEDGTVCIDACNGMVHMLLHNTDGIAFIHYDSEGKALEALVMLPDGRKYSLYFCSTAFTFIKIDDILNIPETDWKRIEKTDTDGILHIYTGGTSDDDKYKDRHLATAEDLKLLWEAFQEHSHTYNGSATSGPVIPSPLPDNPQYAAGIIVKDGGTLPDNSNMQQV